MPLPPTADSAFHSLSQLWTSMLALLKAFFLFPFYYWKYRVEIWESFIDEIPFVHRPEQSLEIWLTAERSRKDNCWTVKLPQRCVTCGKWGASHTENAVHQVDDYSSPALLAFLGVTSGGLAGRFWNLWAFPGAIYLGMVAGTLFKTRNEVRIQFCRCPQHADDKRYPRLRVFGEKLIIRVGDKSLRKDFHEPERKPYE